MKFTNIAFIALCSFALGVRAAAEDTTTLTTNPDRITTTAADDTTTSTSRTTTSATTVYYTTTLADGGVATLASKYSQKFETFYTAVASPSSGSVGLGTLTGTVGQVRSYQTVTITTAS